MHLTNFSVNKKNLNFQINNDDSRLNSKWTLSQLKQAMREQKINTDQLFAKIDDIIVKTVLSAEHAMFTAFE